MEYNKPVSNPMLIGAIALMKAENTQERRKMVSKEIVKAQYLSPATVEPAPIPDANGETRLGPENHIQIPVLVGPDGKQFFLAFTDMTELKKWKDEEGQQTLSMSIEDYAGVLFRPDAEGNPSPVAGFAINPFTENIIVPKEMVAQYMKAKLTQANGNPVPPEVQ